MAASEISICNSALAKLGAARIKSLNGEGKEAEMCKLRYADCRDVVLQSHPWKCAIRRTVLSPLTTPPAFGAVNAFELPADFIRQLPDEGGEVLNIEGNTILAAGNTVNLRYVARIEDATLYPPYLSEVIALKLAADICYAFVQTAAKQQLQEQLYENALRRARFLDSSGSKAPSVNSDYLLNSRTSAVTINVQS